MNSRNDARTNFIIFIVLVVMLYLIYDGSDSRALFRTTPRVYRNEEHQFSATIPPKWIEEGRFRHSHYLDYGVDAFRIYDPKSIQPIADLLILHHSIEENIPVSSAVARQWKSDMLVWRADEASIKAQEVFIGQENIRSFAYEFSDSIDTTSQRLVYVPSRESSVLVFILIYNPTNNHQNVVVSAFDSFLESILLE